MPAWRSGAPAMSPGPSGRRSGGGEKWVGVAAGATLTSVCQATIGEARSAPDGAALYRALIGEAVAVGRAAGAALPDDAVEAALAFIHALPAGMKTSMQLDF